MLQQGLDTGTDPAHPQLPPGDGAPAVDVLEDPREVYDLLSELAASGQVGELLDDFHQLLGVSLAIIDLQGRILAASRWQRLCTEFHRVHPRCRERCIESDTELANRIEAGSRFTRYRCRNGLTDCASPIVIGGVHVANFFVGQFLEGPPNTADFTRQAEEFGFPRAAYLEALAEVPVVPPSRLPAIMNLLVHFNQFLSIMIQERLQERQAHLMARFGRIIDNSLDEIYVFSADARRFVFVNRGARANLGYSMAELGAMTPLDLKPEMSAEAFAQVLEPLRAGERDLVVFETRHRRKDGTTYPVEVHLQLMREEEPPVFVAYIQDIAERKRLEERLREQAATDVLTGIANRRHFMQAAEAELNRLNRYGGAAALLMMDLDHFKGINDRWGHKAGDEVLRHFTGRVRAGLRECDLFGRLGGEEFAVLLPETGLQGAYDLAERLRRDIAAAAVVTAKGAVAYTVSIGVTVFSPGQDDIDRALGRADEALYTAKGNGRNRVEAMTF